MKPKAAIVPKWEPPETKRLRFEIRRLEFTLHRRGLDRRERERTETLLAEARAKLS